MTDIFSIDQGIILHQINCRKVMGAGLAKAIRDKYPKHYADFIADNPKLGKILITRIHPTLFIVGLYAQDAYGRDKRYTDYPALQECLQTISLLAARKPTLPIYAPKGIGAGLAGGDWQTIQNIFQATLPQVTWVDKP